MSSRVRPPAARPQRASPRPPISRVLLLCLWCLLGAFMGPFVGTARGGEGAPSRQELEQLLGMADAILAQIGELRGLAVPGPLVKTIRPRRAIVRRYLELLHEQYPPARLEAERKALVKFALIPPDFPLERFLADVAGEQVAAYYDHLRGEIVLADWLPAPIQVPVLTHELVHALQDRYLNLRKLLAWRPGHSDALMARHALLEGEATAIMADLLAKSMGGQGTRRPDVSALLEQGSGLGSPILDAAPKFLRDQLLFPYTAGTAFVEAFRRLHDWPEFTRVYRDAPRSTEQILHPEKYLVRRDDPQIVLLPDLRGVLGPGWTLVLEDDAGELAVREILERFLPGDAARAAAAGWGGDRYQLYEGPAAGGAALIFLAGWDTEPDARRFAAAYARLIPQKYPAARGGPGGAGRWQWAQDGQDLTVERRGKDVLVMEGLPRARAGHLREWVWRLRAAQR